MQTARMIIIFVLFTLFFLAGCTLHFKATDLELDSQANSTYHLEKMDLLVDSE